MEKIGIIIVNYNGLDDTIECIKSIEKSEFNDYEIFVVDNNSNENVEILNSFPKVNLNKLNENLGFGIANNIGTQMAIQKGCDYILLLNNDTIINSDTLMVLSKYCNDKDIVTCAINYYDYPDELWYGGGEISKWKGTFKHKKYKNTREVGFISGCLILFSVSCYENIGLFSEEYFMYYEDSDFSIKAREAGYRLIYTCETSIKHKVGKSSGKITGLKDYYLTRNRLYILKKYNHFFRKTSIVYFIITRMMIVFKNVLCGQDNTYIKMALTDFKNNNMGKKL